MLISLEFCVIIRILFMKVVLVHDQLREFGGAERVLIALKKIFPEAPVYTTTYCPQSLGPHARLIKNWTVIPSWFGKIPILNRFYSPLRFLTPLIWERFDFSNYDLVISSSGSWMSKGIITKKPTVHISYVHHPPRYLYGYETAIEWQKYWPIKLYGTFINHFLRLWDYQSSQRPDYFIANSKETQRRIQKFYRRDSVVIYPPVNIPQTFHVPPSTFHDVYFLTVSRLTRAKHIEVLITAANQLKKNLKIIGSGRDEKYLKSIAGPTIEFLGNIPDQQLEKLYLSAKAFLFAAVDEEFGIAPVEAMARGLPVIAYRSGGVPEYLQDGVNGYLYNSLTEAALVEKIRKLESLKEKEYLKMRQQARKTAEEFRESIFIKKITQFIEKVINHSLNRY